MTEQKTSSRRALMKGVAWAAPVAAVAVAAPAYATSHEEPPIIVEPVPGAGNSCKDNAPGNAAYYYLTFSFENPTDEPITLTITDIQMFPNSGTKPTFPEGGLHGNVFTFTVGPGQTINQSFCSTNAPNAAQGNATMELSIAGATYNIEDLAFPTVPPCDDPYCRNRGLPRNR